MVFLGFFIKRTRMISDKTVKDLSTLLLSVFLPFSIVASGNESCSREMMTNIGLSFLFISLYYLLAFAFSFVTFTFVSKDKGKRATSINMCVFANTGFIGIPLAQVIFGNEGTIFAVIYNLLYNVFLFTIGIRLFGNGKDDKAMTVKEILLDPLTTSSLVAVALFFSPVKLPSVLQGVFETVGNVCAPISMIIIGTWLVGVELKRIIRRPISYMVSFLRLIVFPLLMFIILKAIGTEETMRNTIVLLSALPVGSLNVILAEKYGHDVAYVNEAMLLSLCLSLVTIPLVVCLF